MNGYISYRKRLGVLIGDITVYGDEIPIHELDLIFDAEGAKFTEPIDDKQSETSSVTSPSGNRRISVSRQLLRDNPSSAAELLTRVQHPKELPAVSSHYRHPSEALDMIPRHRSFHLVDIIEDDNDITNTLTELCRLGVLTSAPNSPRKSKLNSAEKSDTTKFLSEVTFQEGELFASTTDEEPLSQLLKETSMMIIPPSPVMEAREVPTSEEDPERLTSEERETSSDVDSSSLQPIALFASPGTGVNQERNGLDTHSPHDPSPSVQSSPLTIETPSTETQPSLEESPARKSISGRWSRIKAQQHVPPDSLLPVPRNSESSSISYQNIPRGSSGGKLIDGDVASLYSSEDPQFFGLKSNSSPITSHEQPGDLMSDSRALSQETKVPIPSYTGSEEFVNLSISDNLQKYFTEQVFGHGRPSGDSPYMRYGSIPSASLDCSDGYVEVPLEPERLVALYREIVIEIPETTAPSYPKPSTPEKKPKKKSKGKSGDEENRDDQSPLFLSLVFALTDLNLYVIQDNFSNLHKFMDAPIPIVRRIHPIETCR